MPAATMRICGHVERIGEKGSMIEHTCHGRTQRRATPVATHQDGLREVLSEIMDDSRRNTSSTRTAPTNIAAVGHRVVHGGEAFTSSVVLDERVLETIQQCVDLAPLHNPANLAGILAAQQALPHVPHVACFDTAFHATIPPTAAMYALPYHVYEKYRVRRYGFHGSSHRYVANRAARFLDRPSPDFNGITCHLGNGCSVAAVRAGVSVDTSMGLTPLEGLIMGTRCGDIDPAILFYLHDKGHDVESLNQMCNKQSGLLGISGLSNDVRTLQQEAASGNQRARLALDMFCYRVKKYIGSYLAALGHVHAVVFTGGIGENAADVRAQICHGLDRLGIQLDDVANRDARSDERTVSLAESPIQVLVIPTDEEAVIAGDTYDLVKHGA